MVKKNIDMHETVNGVDQEHTSMEHVKRSDVFPKKLLVSDDDNLRVPFPLLSGESAEFLGRTADGIVVLSNFRLLIRYKESFINVPLGLIESVEMRDIFYLHVYCKDATVMRCAFSTNETCLDWYKRLSVKTAPHQKNEEVFAFAYHAWCADRSPNLDQSNTDSYFQLHPQDQIKPYSFTSEIERMKFDLSAAWRYTEINKNFGLCQTYPSEHIVPKCVPDENLKKVGGFRALQRFPTVVWRNCRNGAVLVRSSQPEMGFFGWRNTDDENLLSAIPKACAMNPGTRNKHKQRDYSSGSDLSSDDSSLVENGVDSLAEPKKMLIIDCRSYGAAFANRAKGGGVECQEYYQSCEIQFMNLANIHSVRKSCVALRLLCSSGLDQASWLSGLENTKWLHNMASLLKAATLVVTANEKEGKPVLVHCSDGWDRTPQIISLAELMLDPYYRTVQGFQVLVEREWLNFGHKFADRCGNGVHSEDANERCPVFLQWLECVYQLLLQFPCQLQFNEAFLVKLVQHTYSCLFGTFLCNTVKERISQKLDQNTTRVWSLLKDRKFYNHLYAPSVEHEVLYPATHVQSLKLWTSVYLSNNSSFAGPEDTANQNLPTPDSPEPPGLQKTRSCENLLFMNDLNSSLSRRKSDPNIAMEHCEQQTQKLLKDAMSGETSCSSESVKSSENNTSLSENGDVVSVNGMENLHHNGEVAENDKKNDNLENGEITNGLANGKEDTVNEKENDEESKELTVENDNNIESEGDNDPDEGQGLVSVNGDVGKGQFSQTEEDRQFEIHHHLKLNFNSNVAVENGINTDQDSEHVNGGEIHEMNGHCNTMEDRLNSPDSSNESSENSIETISENEDSANDVDSNILENGANKQEIADNLEREKTETCNGTQNGNAGPDIIHSKSLTTKYKQRMHFSAASDKYAPSLESSTDTVTEDVHNCDSNQTLTPSPNTSNGNVYKVASLQSLCDKANSSHRIKTMDQCSSISTSTSDLTDSRVLDYLNGPHGELLLNGDTCRTSLKLRCFLAHGLSSGTNGTCKGVTVDTSMTPPLYQIPISPQSLSSTCPPTPGTSDGKSIDTPVPRYQSGVGRHLDIDGLTVFNDPVQRQIQNIQSRHEQEILELREQLESMRGLLAQHAAACNADGVCNLDLKVGHDSPGSCDMQSIQSNYSNAASDASWDQMDDPEVNITRWIPDHLVTQCASCDRQFSTFTRKHHCRNCGRIFCHDCCKNTMPLPHQMIHTEERVCQGCYQKCTLQLSKSIIEMDNGIAASN